MYNITELPLDLIREIGYIKELIPINKYFHYLLFNEENIRYDKRLRYFSKGIEFACLKAFKLSWTSAVKMFLKSGLDIKFADNCLLRLACFNERSDCVYYLLDNIDEEDICMDNYYCHKVFVMFNDNRTLYYLSKRTKNIPFYVLKELLELCVVCGNFLAYKYLFHKYGNGLCAYDEMMLACIGGYIGYFNYNYDDYAICKIGNCDILNCDHIILSEDDVKECIETCLEYDQGKLLSYILKNHNMMSKKELKSLYKRNCNMLEERGCINSSKVLYEYIKYSDYIYSDMYDKVIKNQNDWKRKFMNKSQDGYLYGHTNEIIEDIIYEPDSMNYIKDWNWNSPLLQYYDFNEEKLEELMIYCKL